MVALLDFQSTQKTYLVEIQYVRITPAKYLLKWFNGFKRGQKGKCMTQLVIDAMF